MTLIIHSLYSRTNYYDDMLKYLNQHYLKTALKKYNQ